MTKISFVLLASLVSISAVLSLPVPSDPAPALPKFNHGDVVAVRPKDLDNQDQKTLRHQAVVVGGPTPDEHKVHDVAITSSNLPAAHYDANHQAPASDYHPGLAGNINTGKPDKIKEADMQHSQKQGLAGVPVAPDKLKSLKDTIADNCKRDGGCKVKVNSGVIKPAQKVGGMRVANKAGNGKGK